ncbi:DUF4190 domain-containing protein [Streptomyces sp. NPDC049590]|uniref:DUF4190 domain-containing protein n=1 Tax=Streptomyces sp. NPDC049590 TaxID=3154834 RepID=UPI003420C393
MHDQRTLTSLPATPERPAPAAAPPARWAGPADGTAVPAAAPHAVPAPPAAPQPNPFAPPAPTPPRHPFAPPGPHQGPHSFAAPGPDPYPAPNPFAPPAAGPAAPAPHVFGPPAGAEPVPPPPIAPDGPGQVPYGYPGTLPAYAHAPYAGAPYPAGNGYGWSGTQAPPSNGMGTASLVLGILADIGFLAWPLALVLAVLAIIFGALGRGKAKRGEATNPGVALAGLICGVTGVVLVLIVFAAIIAAFG